MSKRPRHSRKGATSADHSGPDELPLVVVNSSAFQAFDSQMDQALNALEVRWGHVAAPMSLNVRRVVPLPNRRPSEQA